MLVTSQVCLQLFQFLFWFCPACFCLGELGVRMVIKAWVGAVLKRVWLHLTRCMFVAVAPFLHWLQFAFAMSWLTVEGKLNVLKALR